MAAGMAIGLVRGLAVVMLLVIGGMVVGLYCNFGMVLVDTGGDMCRPVAVGTADRWRVCRQTLHGQGQQQQPEGNQSQGFHGLKFRRFRSLLQR